MSVDEAERMAAAARNVPNLVWFNYRRVPAVALAKQLVDEGRLGNVYHYRAVYLQSWGGDPARKGVWRFNRAEAGYGAIGDLLTQTHVLALLLYGDVAGMSVVFNTLDQDG